MSYVTATMSMTKDTAVAVVAVSSDATVDYGGKHQDVIVDQQPHGDDEEPEHDVPSFQAPPVASTDRRRIRRSSWTCPEEEAAEEDETEDEVASWTAATAAASNCRRRSMMRRRSSSRLRWTRNSFRSSAASSGVDSNGYGGVERRSSIWTRMAKKQDIWEDTDYDSEEEEELSCKNVWTNAKYSIQTSCRNTWKTLRSHYYIAIVALLVFSALCAVGIATIMAFARQYRDEKCDQALQVAVEQGQWFSEQLDAAILPLFTMAQFVKELPYFSDLPHQIGPGGQAGSAPYVQDSEIITHRNVSGICNNPTTVENFNRIAKSIKEAAHMERVLVNIQLAPQAVVCLLYPMMNTEDFDPPLYMDNSNAVGHDLLKDPARKAIAEQTVSASGIVTAGPLTLRQCQECDPLVQEAIIARLPISMPNYTIHVNDQVHESWGFAVALINWGALVERSDVFARFKAQKMEFILSRTDQIYNQESGDYFTQRKTLAVSDGAYRVGAKNFVNTSLDTTNNEWEMSVGFEDGLTAPWLGWAIALSVVVAFFISVLLMMILVEKQNHKDLLREMLPANALKKIQRGETCVERYNIVTAFFCDIVGYTSMSAEMSPLQVMKMLNSFYSNVDKLAGKHGVYKIETIGDAYMCVGGCPTKCLGPEGAERVALFALGVIELVKEFRMDDGSQIVIRVGINSGPVVAGVVGSRRPQYTIFGDTVNTAARMESTSEGMKIQCSEATFRLLRDAPNYTFQMVDRGHIEAKGKGKMQTWFIEGAEKGQLPLFPQSTKGGDSTSTASTDCEMGHVARRNNSEVEASNNGGTDIDVVMDTTTGDGESCSTASSVILEFERV